MLYRIYSKKLCYVRTDFVFDNFFDFGAGYLSRICLEFRYIGIDGPRAWLSL